MQTPDEIERRIAALQADREDLKARVEDHEKTILDLRRQVQGADDDSRTATGKLAQVLVQLDDATHEAGDLDLRLSEGLHVARESWRLLGTLGTSEYIARKRQRIEQFLKRNGIQIIDEQGNFRLTTPRRETQATINEWQSTTFGDDASPISTATAILGEVWELMKELLKASPDPVRIRKEAADINIFLYYFALSLGFDLAMAVDEKMAENRGRAWEADGTGHYRHVKVSAAPWIGKAFDPHGQDALETPLGEQIDAGGEEQ